MDKLIIRNGEEENAGDIDTGPVISRNDDFFKIILRLLFSLLTIALILILVLSLESFHSYFFGFHSSESDAVQDLVAGLVTSFVAAFIIVLLAVFKTMDHGIWVYQNGIDIFESRLIRIDRVFIPFQEIERVSKSMSQLIIWARHSKRRWRFNCGYFGDEGIRALEDGLAGRLQGTQRPKLVVYSDSSMERVG